MGTHLIGKNLLRGVENYEPHHEKTCLCHMRTTKVHLRSLISAFVVRCLASIIPLLAIAQISSFCSWVGRFESYLVANPEDRFSRVETNLPVMVLWRINLRILIWAYKKPEDHWLCIVHLSAEDMLKSTVIEEMKFKHSPWPEADNAVERKFLCQQEGLITMVICCKFEQNLSNLWLIHIFAWFKCI